MTSRHHDAERNTFTQYYGSRELDAALLMIPIVGFLPADDDRVRGTVAAVEEELLVDGFVLRYTQDRHSKQDGLPPGEGAFLACTFWLADNYSLQGRTTRRSPSSNGCCRFATTLDYWRKSTTPVNVGWSATSPRPSATSR